MLDLTADQIRLLLTLTSEEWGRIDRVRRFTNDGQRAINRQIELEGIQEKLRQALADVPPDPRYPETIDGGTPR